MIKNFNLYIVKISKPLFVRIQRIIFFINVLDYI